MSKEGATAARREAQEARESASQLMKDADMYDKAGQPDLAAAARMAAEQDLARAQNADNVVKEEERG